MTNTEKTKIRKLREQGFGYKKISAQTGIPLNTVKSFCKRDTGKDEKSVCLFCGTGLKLTPHKREKKFCSDKCRYAWWSKNRDKRCSRAPYRHECAQCGAVFYTDRTNSRYCCASCYSLARRNGHDKRTAREHHGLRNRDVGCKRDASSRYYFRQRVRRN